MNEASILQNKASDPVFSVWVGASAGTGKTKVLTDRVLRLLLSGTAPEKILCLTFTKAAAAEMSLRITKTLAKWAIDSEENLIQHLQILTDKHPSNAALKTAKALFVQVIENSEGPRIQTIHAFCQSILRRFPLESNLPPHFELIDDLTADRLIEMACLEVSAREITSLVTPQDFIKLVKNMLRDRRAFFQFFLLEDMKKTIYQTLDIPSSETAESFAEAACLDQAFDTESLTHAAKILQDGSKTDQEKAWVIRRFLLLSEENRTDQLPRYISAFLTLKNEIKATLATKMSIAARPALEVEAKRLQVLINHLQTLRLAEISTALMHNAKDILEKYEHLKAEQALLDYDDLIYKTDELLTRSRMADWVLFKLDGGIDHLLIDEAQDTNPDQWNIISHLSEAFLTDPKKTVFVVGDEKQSIFSFQRADPKEFARANQYLSRTITESQKPWKEVDLNISFRSSPAILKLVDAVFEGEHHESFREGQAGSVIFWPLVEPEAAPPPASWPLPITTSRVLEPSEQLAREMAETIKGWLRKGEMLESRGRPLQAGDIMVLVRRRSSFVDQLVQSLKRCDVPVSGVDRMILTEQLAVMDLIAMGNFLLCQDDDLNLATLLKTPLIGVSEDELFTYCNARKSSLWTVLQAENAKIAAYLQKLLKQKDDLYPFELFSFILNTACPQASSGRKAIIARLGVDSLDPLEEFLNICLEYEQANPPSLQGFLHFLTRQDMMIKREPDQAGKVRIMTVHGAKGLQSPVVFLPDTISKPQISARNRPTLLWLNDTPLWAPFKEFEDSHFRMAKDDYLKKQDKEYRRLLYVALTRAEDRLYICGWKNRNIIDERCWYRLIEKGLEKLTDKTVFFTEQTAEPVTDSVKDSVSVSHDLEPWTQQPALLEKPPFKPLLPSRPEDSENIPCTSPAIFKKRNFQKGLAIHHLLEILPDIAPDEHVKTCQKFLHLQGFPAPDITAITQNILNILNHPDFAVLFGPNSRAEVPLTGLIGNRTITGQVDRMVVTNTEIFIIDYKTNRQPPKTVEQIPDSYRKQLALYKQVLQEIYPDKTVHTALLWTENLCLMRVS